MTHRSSFCSTAALLLALTGCSSSGSGSESPGSSSPVIARSNLARVPASAVSPDDLTAAVAANNAFAVDLYAHVLADPTLPASGNVLTSPISASLALTMTYAGAREQTATEMARALHLDASAGDAIFAGQNALSAALNGRGAQALDYAKQGASQGDMPSPDDYQFQLVNSVWGEKTYRWEPAFLDTLAQNYGAGVYQEDFENAPDVARLAINGWVSDQTKGKINDLLAMGVLDKATRMVLVNAIHLKLPWATAFLPADTASAPFTLADGTQVSVPFMNQTEGFAYLDDGKAQIVSLPLRGGLEAVVIALPHEGVKLADYEATLSAGSAALSASAPSALVALSLPKMTFTSPSVSLSGALKAMGMKQAFDMGAANLTGIATPQQRETLYVSEVLQKATVAIQETGAEAAAATAVIIGSTTSVGVTPPTPTPMLVNRPYLIAIVDRPTSAVLMVGHIQDPSNAGGP